MADIGPRSVVVCVEAPAPSKLMVGHRYVVHEVCRYHRIYPQGDHGFVLTGPAVPEGFCCFRPRLFRPIDARDSAIFERMIAGPAEKVRA